MAFREAVACPALDLIEEAVGSLLVEIPSVFTRSLDELLPELLHGSLLGVLGYGFAEPVRFGIGNASHLRHYVVHLLLEDDAAVGFAKRLGEAGVEQIGTHPAVAAGDEALDYVSLDG